jgi:hypothetical protein
MFYDKPFRKPYKARLQFYVKWGLYFIYKGQNWSRLTSVSVDPQFLIPQKFPE